MNIIRENVITYKALETIDLSESRSMLSNYIDGVNPPVTAPQETLIYPFGCNESQKLAVETTLRNSISIVEGPSGTGKTQTILNIIANLIALNKTVAMKKLFSAAVLLLCANVTLPAQEVPAQGGHRKSEVISPQRVEVAYSKTVHILFPSQVKYVDLGSTDIIAGKAVDAENVVRVKAAVRNFADETNFSVITADGRFYNFNAVYSDEPSRLSIRMDD